MFFTISLVWGGIHEGETKTDKVPLADILITTVVNSFNREVLEAKIFGEEL